MTTATETFTTESGLVFTITTTCSNLSNSHPMTKVQIERDGKVLANKYLDEIEGNIHPSIHTALYAAVRRTSLTARGTTEEAEAAREAGLVEYYNHTAAVDRMMSI
jgi:hypothetical protein